MNKTQNILSFVEALKGSGITISDEQLLVKRLTKACENGVELGVELAKVAVNNKASGITFYADQRQDASGLIKAWKEYDLDGYAWRDFIQSLRPLA